MVKNSLNNPSTSATTGENNYSSVSSEYHLPQIKSNRSNIPELNRSKIGTGAGRDDLLAENPLFNQLKNSPIFQQIGIQQQNDENSASRGAFMYAKGNLKNNLRFQSDEFNSNNNSVIMDQDGGMGGSPSKMPLLSQFRR